ncbi:MAG: PA2169 family four-helix-bundle protein [Planctomycetota bacterium]|nr:PA2169 family four-helix-bundle protein [Planctomycetota bacterium]
MSIETKQHLASETLEKLKNLIQINLDSEKGLLEASKQTQDKEITSVFLDLSEDRAKNARDLQMFVRSNDEVAQDEGSYIGTLHRVWLDFRSTMTGGNAMSILSEAERGEDYIKKIYEEVLIETAGSAMNDVLTRQYATIKAGHDRIRELRNTYSKD